MQSCSTVRPDTSVKQVRLLQDAGVLQSLACSHVLIDYDYKPTGEFRIIHGITGKRKLCKLQKNLTSSTNLLTSFVRGRYTEVLPQPWIGIIVKKT